jgi:VanZ family protein
MKNLRPWLPAVIWAIALFVSSSLPPVVPGDRTVGGVGLDKWAHLVAYGLLALLILWPLRRHHNLPLPKAVLLAILLASAYGATDEWHQTLVPNRWCTLGDWAADTIGAALAGLSWYLYESIRRRQTHR